MAETANITATKFELVTPAKVLMACDAAMVVVPGAEGLFGAMPRHMPMISTLKRGVVEVHESRSSSGGAHAKIMVDGGIADVTPERCTILAERAENLDEADKADIDSRRKAAEESGNADEAAFLAAVLEKI